MEARLIEGRDPGSYEKKDLEGKNVENLGKKGKTI